MVFVHVFRLVAGEEDTCAPFFALNRLKGQLYDGTTRLFSDDSAQAPIATGMNIFMGWIYSAPPRMPVANKGL